MLIAIVNHSPKVTTPDLAGITAAVRRQAFEASDAWGLTAPTVLDVATPEAAPSGALLLAILDDADQAGALGYHSETSDGRQFARVFVSPVLDAGGTILGTSGDPSLSVSCVVSHEVIEALGDPACNRWADAGDKLVAIELCDPVQGVAYVELGVAVSDYALPAWFDPLAAGPYSRTGAAPAPFALAPGGYAIVRTAGGETQVDGTRAPHRPAHPASRTTRRGV